MDEKLTFGTAVRLTNWMAKDLEQVANLLESIDWKAGEPLPSYCSCSRMDAICNKYGVQLNLVNNFCATHTGVRYFIEDSEGIREVSYTFKKPDLRNIKSAVKAMRKDAEDLYLAKSLACANSGCPVIRYDEINGDYYKVYALGDYKPHCPVTSEELAKIKEGLIPTTTFVRSATPTPLHYISDDDFAEAYRQVYTMARMH